MEYVEWDKTTFGKRTNRYLEAPIDWDAIPEQFRNDLGLAIRGTFDKRYNTTSDKCGSIQYIFPIDDELKFAPYNCHKLICAECGLNTSFRQGKRIAFRMLSMKATNYQFFRFLSLNFYNKETNEYLNENYSPGINENFHHYLKRIIKFTSSLLKDNGMEGFYLVFHPTRLKKVDNELEVQVWSPHFHCFGVGVMTKSSDFYNKYGFTYRMQVSTRMRNTDVIKNQLVGRIAYRLNHCGFSFNPSGRQSNSYIAFGLLANNMIKTLDQKEVIDYVLDKNKNRVVAKDLSEFISSDKPERIKIKMYEIDKRMKSDIKKTGYARIKDEYNFKRLNNYIFDKKLKINDKWKDSELETIVSLHTNEPIYLVEKEIIEKVQVKGYEPIIISNYELHKERKPRKYLLESVNNSANSVNERFKIKRASKCIILA